MKSFLKLFLFSLLISLCLSQISAAGKKAKGKSKGKGKVNSKVGAAIGVGAAAGAAGTLKAAKKNKNNSNAAGGLASVYTECLKPGQFVLTFDDGPKGETTLRALNVLNKNGIKGTFFVNSANYVDLVNGPEARNIVKTVFDAGHDIGSHTYQHKDLFQAMEDGTLEINVDQNNQVIKSIIGRTPVFFRPPLGNGGFTQDYCTTHNIPYDPRTEQVRKYLGERGMKVIMWNADTQDWNSEGNVQNAINQLSLSVNAKTPQNGSFITLLHDVHEYSVDVILQEVINYVKKQGYKFVSLAECIGEAPYLEGYNPNQSSTATSNTVTTATGNTYDPAAGSNALDTSSYDSNLNVGNTDNIDNTLTTQNPTLTNNNEPIETIDIDSSSIKSIVTSFAVVLVLSLVNALLY